MPAVAPALPPWEDAALSAMAEALTADEGERTPEQQAEWERCRDDRAYFIRAYVQIYNATLRQWIPFDLWPAQAELLAELPEHQRVVILKARQLGITWLVLGYALHLLVFFPVATVLLFSKRDDEAVELITRLTGMHARLPAWMRERVTVSNDHTWQVSTGSQAMGFPTTGGDSYTASLVIADEFDLVPDQGRLLGQIEPTIDAGGQLILLSRVDKSRPNSDFQRTYAGARAGKSDWHPVFLPWSARPERDQAWYDARKAAILARTGALDALWEQYPSSDVEALAPNARDKRFPGHWLAACYRPLDPIPLGGDQLMALPQLTVYRRPEVGRSYVIGADTAEGNPNSDESACAVLDAATGEEVASLAGLFEPSVYAGHLAGLSGAYNRAPVLVERNNHGHAVLLWLRDHASGVRLLKGLDGREGWLTNSLGKAQLMNDGADALRDAQVVIHTLSCYQQLAGIEGATLRAPQGDHDDQAIGLLLAHVARARALIRDEVAGGAQSHGAKLRARLGGA